MGQSYNVKFYCTRFLHYGLVDPPFDMFQINLSHKIEHAINVSRTYKVNKAALSKIHIWRTLFPNAEKIHFVKN